MSTTIKYTYTNLLGKDITSQQVSNMKEYIENVFIGTLLKKKETLRYIKNWDKLSKKIEYYLEANENLQNVLSTIISQNNPDRIIIFTKENEQYGFAQWRWRTYNNLAQEQGFGGLKVLDNKNREIFSCNYSGNNAYETATKNLYENLVDNASEDLLLTVKYDILNNEIWITDINQKLDYGNFKPFDPDYMILLNPSLWSSHSYYHSHLPILPNSTTV